MPVRGHLVVAVIALALLGGCGSSPSDQVRTTLEGYARAFAHHDYQALCDTYLAPSIVDGLKATGLPCEAAVRGKVSSTVDPVLKVGAITVRGDRATARVHTMAKGEAPSDDTLQLVRTGGHWRISSLSSG